MADASEFSHLIKHSEYSKLIRRSLWGRLGILLLLGCLAVVAFPFLDKAITNGEHPGVISFVGTGLVISIITYYLFTLGLRDRFAGNRRILAYAIFYNILLVVVKFTLAPASLYAKNPTLVVDHGGISLGDLSDFNGNIFGIALLIFGVFLLYLFMFNVLKWITLSSIKKRFNIKSKHIRAKAAVGFVLLMVAASIFTGGAILIIPFILSMLAFSNSIPYLGYVFSTGYSLAIALVLMSAIACCAAMFVETEVETVTKRNLNLLITVIWVGIGLLLVYHAIWALYLFVLTTIWPFKVVTVTSK